MSKVFIISSDTGNKEDDIFNTIYNFTEHEMGEFREAIKLKRDKNGEISGESLIFRYPDCQEIISTTKDITKLSAEKKKLILKRTTRINSDYFLTMEFERDNTSNFRLDFIYNKIYLILDRKAIYINIISNERYNFDFYNRCFEIISSDELFLKFLNFDENKEFFGEDYSKEEYVLELSRILGYGSFDICKDNLVYRYNFITQDMINRYLSLRNIINVDIEMLGENPFELLEKKAYSKERQVEIDNDWKINNELITYVISGMNPNYNVLEKISHIYIMLCYALRYNLGYHIKQWGALYNKNRLESISLVNNEIICSEFSLICTKIINTLFENVEARCIITGKEQHLSFGILIRDKNIRINFDSTHFAIGDDKFDDLGRVKLGLPLIGIEYVCDRNNEFRNAFYNVYNTLCANGNIENENLIAVYENLSTLVLKENDFYENISEFLKSMNAKNIRGSELLGMFKKLYQNNYFGKIIYSIVGEDKKMTFAERLCIDTPEELLDGLEENIIIDNGGEYFLLRLNQCEIFPISFDELNWLFEEEKMKYFNLEYQIEGVGVKPTLKVLRKPLN